MGCSLSAESSSGWKTGVNTSEFRAKKILWGNVTSRCFTRGKNGAQTDPTHYLFPPPSALPSQSGNHLPSRCLFVNRQQVIVPRHWHIRHLESPSPFKLLPNYIHPPTLCHSWIWLISARKTSLTRIATINVCGQN